MDTCALNGFYSAAQRARFLAAIPKRRSVRSFSAAPDTALKSALHYAAARVCLPGIRIELKENDPEKLFLKLPVVGGVTGTSCYAALIMDEQEPYAHLHAGISGEAFVLEAVSLGLGACWLGTYKRGGVDIELNEGERIAAIIALGVADEELPGNKRKKLTEICNGDPTVWPLWAYHAAECVRFAPSAMNLQPWKLSFAGRTMVLSRTAFGGLMDMGIALLHMSLGLEDKEHIIRWGEGKEIALLIAEDRI
ncbi:MAG: hypothetical protein E7329_12555 [Clostridiales bacterium]|nr:hypothetical protein [Clostridiales bacterium]